MTKIHAFRTKPPGGERYEKHIADLEQQNADLREESRTIRARFDAQRTNNNRKRLQHYQGLMNFLSGLHGQLGKVQNDLLSHIGKLNALVMTENDNGVSEMTKKLKELANLTAELGQGKIEIKTSGSKLGALPMLEDED